MAQEEISPTRRAAIDPGFWRPSLAGMSAVLVGIGLARFAYTPLIPALIAAHWFSPSDAVYLGAANLGGYFLGAVLGRPLARVPRRPILRVMMLAASASFFAGAWPQSFLWYFFWRVVAGVSGGALMVLAAPSVLPTVPPARRGLAGGVIFTGVGLGIAASGTLLPLLLRLGLAETWCALGVLAALLTALTWNVWPAQVAAAPLVIRVALLPRDPRVRALAVEYALNAVGFVPHMVFLVDFIARGLGRGLAEASAYWVLFGVGAMLGPITAGHLADHIGFKWALWLAYVLEGAAVALLAFSSAPAALVVSSLVAGAFVPGIVSLVLGRIGELMPGDAFGQAFAWSATTTAFAMGQAVAAYGYSFLFAAGSGYRLLFAIGAAALAAALLIDLAAGRARLRQARA
ncbi:MAG TPA: YbfB/YjiJ family MFS transporter [Stellaceae bacterium]|nr:YbfB/YjiJ family MFS transporter [Stellaceae bacterium]